MADDIENEVEGKKKSKGLSTPIIIAIIAAVVVILVVVIIFVINIMMNNMKNTILESTGQQVSTTKVEETPQDETLNSYDYLETGRITTNPALSTQFVVVNLGIFYAPQSKAKEENSEEGIDPESKKQRLNALIKHQVNSQIGDMDVMSLQIPRDSLAAKFKSRLEPAFKLEGYKVKDVILVEFIIQ